MQRHLRVRLKLQGTCRGGMRVRGVEGHRVVCNEDAKRRWSYQMGAGRERGTAGSSQKIPAARRKDGSWQAHLIWEERLLE